MTGQQSEELSRGESTRHQRSQRMLLGTGLLVLVAIAIGAIFFLLDFRRDVPKFPSLADHPDTSLHGTMAYTATDDCIHIVALSGSPDKVIYCMPKWTPAEAVALGKPMPPQLVWLPNGRLEVTMFRMSKTPGPGLNKGWQKIVDVNTGVVTDTPTAQVPTAPNLSTRPVTSSTGQTLSYTSNTDTGHVTISITGTDGISHKILDVRGPGHGAYRLTSVFWAPDYKSIIADDGRVLVIAPVAPFSTRILESNGGGNPFGAEDANHAGFAVTDQELLKSM